MAILITGSTGYIGSYVTAFLLADNIPVNLLIRADSNLHAQKRLWQALQLHFSWEEFISRLAHCQFFLGDMSQPQLGLTAGSYDTLSKTTDSIIHCAASLNRKSEKACLNVNLKGTLQVIKLARLIQNNKGLKRFSDVSTVAIAGIRQNEIVHEEEALDWKRSDYDPYARTKKFCEHMVQELLPDVCTLIFRPSVVLGDSRFPQTTQFDMARAFAFFTKLPVLPFPGDALIDIVPVDFVAKSIVKVHQQENPSHHIYHLSAGKASLSYRAIVDALHEDGLRRPTIFFPRLKTPFTRLVNLAVNSPKKWGIAKGASLLKVFLPYLLYNTVFDNERIKKATGDKPSPFDQYAYGLLQFVEQVKFTYPYQPWPVEEGVT